MLTIESLFGSNFIGQLRAIVHMSTSSPDKSSALDAGRPRDCDNEKRAAPTTTKKRSCRNRITRPELGSLYDILHDNAGTTLYVVPICWTDNHSRLLGARFRKRDTIVKPVPQLTSDVWLEPSKMAQMLTSELHTLARQDATPAKAFCKIRAMKHIMSTLFPSTLTRAKTGAELNLYFGHRVFRKVVRIPCVWKSPNSVDTSFDSCRTLPATSFSQPTSRSSRDAGMPMLAYINRSQLAAIRKNLYGVLRGPENSANGPVSNLQRLRSKMLVPADAEQDPYIVAILLAMAQAHFYHETSSRTSSQSSSQPGGRKSIRIAPPSFRDVKVQVITHDEGNDSDPNFVVYTATVTATFLDRFMFPHKAPKLQPGEDPNTGLDISYTPVNFWPILGLKERLSQALGHEIAGDSIYDDPNHIGLWSPLLEPQIPQEHHLPVQQPVYHRPISFKRKRNGAGAVDKREPLSRVLNSSHNSNNSSSFEEDQPSSSDDRPVLSPAAKRRRTARTVSTLEVC